jgi:putative spermidine/putrescine transport system permease protein
MALRTFWHRLPIILMGVYIVLPMVAVLLYSVATSWTQHVLPNGYTLTHWLGGFGDARFSAVLVRSLLLAIACAFFALLLVTPAVYWQKVRNPRIQPLLELMAAIPFATPFVVIAFGLLALSGQFTPQLQGTLWLLLPAHIAVSFSFVYWAIDSSMTAADIPRLSEAATTCGAGPLTILWRVVLPNIGPGIASGAILSFGASFNEIALVQILVGNRFETVPLYMLNLLKNSDADFNQLAVMTSVTFFVTLALSIGVVYLNGGASTQLANTIPGRRRA